jgi:hypothetical protein
MALSGLLAEVTQARVRGLLSKRDPAILDQDDADQLAPFEAQVRSAAVQVVLLTGDDPEAGPVRELAVTAIAYQTGSEIEYATYPEQQAPGDTGRGYFLHQRYLELLAQLRELTGGGITVPVVGRGAPQGSFPPPEPFPYGVFGGDPCSW